MTRPLAEILVIDDEQNQLDTICRGLLLGGYRCHGVANLEAALEALGEGQFQLVLTDLSVAGQPGVERIERIRKQWPELPIVVLSGLASTDEERTVRQMDITLLKKPFDPDTLDATIRRVLELD